VLGASIIRRIFNSYQMSYFYHQLAMRRSGAGAFLADCVRGVFPCAGWRMEPIGPHPKIQAREPLGMTR